MLVLSRQRDETICIGDDVEVTVVDIRGDKVRLGVNAPKEISVHRQEVYEAIVRERGAASRTQPGDLAGVRPAPDVPARAEPVHRAGVTFYVWLGNGGWWFRVPGDRAATFAGPTRETAVACGLTRVGRVALEQVPAAAAGRVA